MKKSIVAAVTAGVLMAGGIGKWPGQKPGQAPESPVESFVNELGTQAAEEFKNVLSQEVSDFLKAMIWKKHLELTAAGRRLSRLRSKRISAIMIWTRRNLMRRRRRCSRYLKMQKD